MEMFYIRTTVDRGYDLYHHGILGQKWGVRRFQNEDGTLTAAGKKRYQEGSSFGSKGREVRAKDAALLKSNIQDYEERGDKETAGILRKYYYSSLIKDLDPREIKFAENYIKIKAAQMKVDRAARLSGGLSRALAGNTAGGLIGSSVYYTGRSNINERYAKEIAENRELARQIKEGRRNQRKKRDN